MSSQLLDEYKELGRSLYEEKQQRATSANGFADR
jgi:hypothetical protein